MYYLTDKCSRSQTLEADNIHLRLISTMTPVCIVDARDSQHTVYHSALAEALLSAWAQLLF